MKTGSSLCAVDRRTALGLGVAAGVGLGVPAGASAITSLSTKVAGARPATGPVVVSSANGINAVKLAYDRIVGGADCADAIVEGVSLVENDPSDMSVGYGGLPNELGVVQLDASVMHGPTHKCGAVACIEDIKNPAAVALLVLKRTDHCLLVGHGARDFALVNGFKAENLLTEQAREVWLRWKASSNRSDDWLNDDEMDWDPKDPKNKGRGPLGMVPNEFGEYLARVGADSHVQWLNGVPYTTGTINCCAVDAAGDLSSCTTTSGLSYKIPGRVGDSPIPGAGMYCDNDIGAAGATGRGEAVIQNCGAFAVVRAMERGLSPTQACLDVLNSIVRKTLEKRLRREDGRVNFDVKMYAVRKDGAYGSASISPGAKFSVCDGKGNRTETCASVYSE